MSAESVAAVVAVAVAVKADAENVAKRHCSKGKRPGLSRSLFLLYLYLENKVDMKKLLIVAAMAAVCVVSCKSKSVEEKLAELNKWNEALIEEYTTGIMKFEGNQEAAEEYADSLIDLFKDYNLKALKGNLDNAVGVAALKNLYGTVEQDEFEEYVNKITAPVHGQDSVFLNGLKEALKAQKSTAEGQMFTDFQVDGVKFSDFVGKGKYVLVDFWASWCGPCRREMPNLRAVYNDFHGDKFDMLSVAVWDKPEDTAKAAEEENITWNQIVNAQKIPTDIYGIEGIPHIILFGPDGTILKRNLRGEDIREAVEEALGK